MATTDTSAAVVARAGVRMQDPADEASVALGAAGASPTPQPEVVLAAWQPWPNDPDTAEGAVPRLAAAAAARAGHRLHLILGWQVDPAGIDARVGIRQVWRQLTDQADRIAAAEVDRCRREYPGLVVTCQVDHADPACLVLGYLCEARSVGLTPALVVVGAGVGSNAATRTTRLNQVREVADCPVLIGGL